MVTLTLMKLRKNKKVKLDTIDGTIFYGIQKISGNSLITIIARLSLSGTRGEEEKGRSRKSND